MQSTVPRTLAAGLISLVVAVTGVTAAPTPARADQDAAAIIAGIIALYAIGRAIEERNDDRAAQQSAARPRALGEPHRGVRGGRGHRNLRVAPARCFRELDTPRGYVRGYGARCMERNVPRPALLPDRCIRRVHTYRGVRNLYGGRCLARNGWEREAGFRP